MPQINNIPVADPTEAPITTELEFRQLWLVKIMTSSKITSKSNPIILI
jgi:predicted glycosyltransferase involved in capsule biosynthesis